MIYEGKATFHQLRSKLHPKLTVSVLVCTAAVCAVQDAL